MSSNTFEQLLRDHAIAHLNSTGGRQTLKIWRKHIWSDTKTAFSQEGFMCNAVKFDGEEAIDSGGPVREYFELLWKNLQFNGFLFTWPDNCRILTHNTYALNHNEFHTFGVCVCCTCSDMRRVSSTLSLPSCIVLFFGSDHGYKDTR